MSNVETILESIEKLTLLEAAELVKAIENEFGVTAAAVVAGGAAKVEAIEEVIKILIGLDYKFYTISELLELDSIISYYQKNLYISGSK